MLWFNKKNKNEKNNNSKNIEIEPETEKIEKSTENVPTKVLEAKESNEKKELKKPIVKSKYKLPPISLVMESNISVTDEETARANVQNLTDTLKAFKVKGTVKKIFIGPRFTTYEVELADGERFSNISSISKEIGISLMTSEPIISPSGTSRNTVSILVENNKLSTVSIHDVMLSYEKDKGIVVPLGEDILGKPVFTNICELPHLLVAGTTGSGKSMFLNSIIVSILLKYKPDEVKMLLIDTKKIELSYYNGIPHLLTPVVTDPKRASIALQKAVRELEIRYDLFSELGIKNIDEYNAYVSKYNKQHPEEPLKKMYYLLTVIDELIDLMLVASRDVEDSIMRITQMGRSAGVHIIVASEKPSSSLINSYIKVNTSSRLSFYLPSINDSRTILDCGGAEKLKGNGDMLFKPKGEINPIRIQGCYVSDKSIKSVINYVCKQEVCSYVDLDLYNSIGDDAQSSDDEFDDPLYDEVVELAIQTGKISASLIQRKFRLGYSRAERILNLLEERGIVGPQNGSKPRDVLVRFKDK